MGLFGQTETGDANRAAAQEPQPRTGPTGKPNLRLRELRLHRACDALTEALVYGMVIFSPWAFGTTQGWSIWLMNLAAYVLGLLLPVKLVIRHVRSYQPPRWGEAGPAHEASAKGNGPTGKILTHTLALLTLAILAYTLTSALNARSTYHASRFSFEYHDSLSWLPHSLNSRSTWSAFWNYLALACSFWAVRDWLLGKTTGEERAARAPNHNRPYQQSFLLPGRLRRLLWVLSINGALVGLEGITQRLSGTHKLLWLAETRINAAAEYQFGPYAYRSNGAQYLNLVWPVCLGFWWTWQRHARWGLNRALRRKPVAHHLLLVCVMIMAAGPIISTSRGGAMIVAINLALATLILLFSLRKSQGLTKLVVCALVGASLALGVAFGWERLAERLQDLGPSFVNREAMYEAAKPMARDYPLYGTGPGTFDALFQLYRTSSDDYWPAQLHNDWLETRITFGWLGSALLAAAFLILLARWFVRGGIQGGWRFTLLLWLALAGSLVHARFDFPFQIYSIVFLFLVLCAILFTLSRRKESS